MQEESRDWIKTGNYVIVKLPKTEWRIGYIGAIDINAKDIIIRMRKLYFENINPHLAHMGPFIHLPLSSPNIKPLSDIMLTSYEDQQDLIYNLIRECALQKYKRKHWCKKYIKKSNIHLAKTLKFNFIKYPTIKIDEDIIYKDLGNIISPHVPQYTLTNIVDSNQSICEGREIKYDDIIIDEFIFNQSLDPFYHLLDQMHNKYMEYNTSIKN